MQRYRLLQGVEPNWLLSSVWVEPHCGQAIFEGTKAYLRPDGRLALFRPEANARRFNRSADQLAMPNLPERLFLDSIEALVRQDREWVPSGQEKSLYLRPFMLGTEVGLGVRPANRYDYLLIASPAGAYFAKGVKPVSVWLSTEYVRAETARWQPIARASSAKND